MKKTTKDKSKSDVLVKYFRTKGFPNPKARAKRLELLIQMITLYVLHNKKLEAASVANIFRHIYKLNDLKPIELGAGIVVTTQEYRDAITDWEHGDINVPLPALFDSKMTDKFIRILKAAKTDKQAKRNCARFVNSKEYQMWEFRNRNRIRRLESRIQGRSLK